MDPVARTATAWGLAVSLGLAGAIWVGSRRLAHFDAALVAYTAAVLFAAFGITYRYAVWLQRPPTAMFWRRGWQAFVRRGWRTRNAVDWMRHVSTDLAGNRFIFARGGLPGAGASVHHVGVPAGGRHHVSPRLMYTLCTLRLSQALDLPWLLIIPQGFFWLALAAWTATFAGLVRRLVASTRQ